MNQENLKQPLTSAELYVLVLIRTCRLLLQQAIEQARAIEDSGSASVVMKKCRANLKIVALALSPEDVEAE